MTIAWRRLPSVPAGDPRPWLIATARNLLLNDWRREAHERATVGRLDGREFAPAPSLELDPALERALRGLSLDDREALILIAWEELTPSRGAQPRHRGEHFPGPAASSAPTPARCARRS